MRLHLLIQLFGELLRNTKKTTRGFSLVELMTAVAILMLVVSGLSLEFSAFDSNVILQQRGYEVAQAVRRTQSYATQIRATDVADTGFSLSYGVSFEKGSDEITLYTYRGTGYPEYPDPDSTDLEIISLEGGFSIGAICVDLTTDTERCAAVDGQMASIAFQRPEVVSYPSTNFYGTNSDITRVRIGIIGPAGADMQWVEIGATGYITTYAD